MNLLLVHISPGTGSHAPLISCSIFSCVPQSFHVTLFIFTQKSLFLSSVRSFLGWSKTGIFCSNLPASEKESHTFSGLFARFRGWVESEERGWMPSCGRGQGASLFPMAQRALHDLTPAFSPGALLLERVRTRWQEGSRVASALSPPTFLPACPIAGHPHGASRLDRCFLDFSLYNYLSYTFMFCALFCICIISQNEKSWKRIYIFLYVHFFPERIQ